MKRADRALFREFLRRRTICVEVKRQNMQPTQEAPDGFVVVRDARVLQMRSEGIDEATHVIVGGARALDALEKGLGVSQLACPGEDILIGAVDLVGASRNRDSQFVAGAPETWVAGGLGNLPDDFFEYLVLGGESNIPLYLDFE